MGQLHTHFNAMTTFKCNCKTTFHNLACQWSWLLCHVLLLRLPSRISEYTGMWKYFKYLKAHSSCLECCAKQKGGKLEHFRTNRVCKKLKRMPPWDRLIWRHDVPIHEQANYVWLLMRYGMTFNLTVFFPTGHLFHKFGITESDWYRIKQSIDSKCRTAWRRKQRGQSLAVKSFSKRTPRSTSAGKVYIFIKEL